MDDTHTTICLRPSSGLRMNLRVRRVTCASAIFAMWMDGRGGSRVASVAWRSLGRCRGAILICASESGLALVGLGNFTSRSSSSRSSSSSAYYRRSHMMMDPQLLLFRRQYYQLFEPDFLAWPPKQLLRDPTVQAWLYAYLFDSDKNSRMPPERYQLRVLKPLASKIEKAIEDPEEDVGVIVSYISKFHLFTPSYSAYFSFTMVGNLR